MSTHYERLGIHEKSSQDEIKSAYRRLSKTLHPDVNKSPDATDQFRCLQESYAILSDKRARKEYDYLLKLDEKTKARIHEAEEEYGIEIVTEKKKKKPPKPPKQQKFRKANVDFEDIPEGFVSNPNRIGGIL